MAEQTDNLAFFQDDSILTEEAFGLKIEEDAMWKSQETEDPEEYMKKFAEYEQSIYAFSRIINKGKIEEKEGSSTAISENTSSVGEDGTVVTKKFRCPNCGKMVDQLLQNGYCSKSCLRDLLSKNVSFKNIHTL